MTSPAPDAPVFSRRRGLAIAAWTKSLALTDMDKAWLAPLIAHTPITASKQERLSGKHKKTLSRHAVLHGEDTDYGSRMNSCRAVSFLALTSWLIPEFARDQHAQLQTPQND